MTEIHVVARDGRWALQVDERDRESFSSYSAAVARGRTLAQREQGTLVLHDWDGKIRGHYSWAGIPLDVPD